jgi:hypothetical protein
MAESTQTYKTHRRFVPVLHFFAIPVLVLNVIAQLLRLNKYRTLYEAWMVLVAIALAVLILAARWMATRVQDRIIRLEERIRLASLLPENMRSRMNDLTPGQLVGLRFASDEEVPGVAQRCFAGELTEREQIKKEIRNWRADTLRV